jgi:hypothetical protein
MYVNEKEIRLDDLFGNILIINNNMNKMIWITVIIGCIIASWYIDADTHKKEKLLNTYSAFETISEEDLHLEKIKYEMKMKEMQILIDKAK